MAANGIARAYNNCQASGVREGLNCKTFCLETARRRERAALIRREVLRMELGEPDGVNVAEELARDRSGER